MRKPFHVRCYAKREQGLWVAVCIDLCLAAQGDSIDEVKRKLEAQINEYVHEALTIDREHAKQLLSRKAPLFSRLEYYWIRVQQRLEPKRKAHSVPRCAFEELVAVPA